ncbi:MAG: hypothetical protein SAL07_19520 [Oscillatoria sp. PMC 1051.18]|nr:hypothetical protein [Oscillatoria sp. PMC 1050.18]MEC5032094.1 hypothetical protein [Oscillatoria sp. PMC 1051.18]
MEETIRIRAINRQDWDRVLKGFEAQNMQQVLEVVRSDGQQAGTICESQDGKCYVNGHPETDYASLQAAATALMKGEAES